MPTVNFFYLYCKLFHSGFSLGEMLWWVPLSLLPFSPEEQFSWGQNPSFQQPMLVHRTHLPSTLSPEHSSPPAPWLSVRPTDSAELSAPHHAERGRNKSLKTFCWLVLFSACISAFCATFNFPFTFFSWKQFQLLEFLIFLFNRIDFLTLLILSDDFRYSWINW